MIAAWDSGDVVWTIEMGGLGPGYEQAIQNLVVELCRDFQLIDDWDAETNDSLQARRDAVYDRYEEFEGYSGAQVGAATSLAVVFCRKGPREVARELGDESRHLMISNHFPKAPSTRAVAEEEQSAEDNEG
jgi:hypothetical protein